METSKNVLIIGAGSGLGRGLAIAYLNQGVRVVATYHSHEPEFDSQFASLLQTIKLDVASEADISSLCHTLKDKAIEIVIHCAAKMSREEEKVTEEFGNLNRQEFEQFMLTNSFGPVKIVQELMAQRCLSKSAKIVMISSELARYESTPGAYWYKLSKAAMNRAVQALAQDLKNFSVSIYSLHPGLVLSERIEHRRDLLTQSSPIPALEVADAAQKIKTTIANLPQSRSGEFVDNEGNSLV